MTSRHGQAFIRIILLFHLSAFSEAVSLARLVKAEIVSPYSGNLINTGVGNPIVPVGMYPRSKASPKRSRGGLLVFNLFIKRPRLDSFLSISNEFALHLEFQHPRFQISGASDLRQCLVPTFKAGGCLPCYGRKRAKAERCQVSNRRNLA